MRAKEAGKNEIELLWANMLYVIILCKQSELENNEIELFENECVMI